MSIWTRILDAVSALAHGEGLSAVFEKLRTPPERSLGFTIAVIALGAKMAKADGQVTRNEVAAFREVFTIAEEDQQNAARLFNLARQDVAGYDIYARRIAAMFKQDTKPLTDLMEGLFHIATADGQYHPGEDEFLMNVADIFGLNSRGFAQLRARFVPDAEQDPYDVLGVSPDMSLTQIKDEWRKLVRDSHPDKMAARGVPAEAVKLAEKRLIAINRAFDTISAKAPVAP